MNYLSDHTRTPRFNAARYQIRAWTRQNMLDEMKLNRLRQIGLGYEDVWHGDSSSKA